MKKFEILYFLAVNLIILAHAQPPQQWWQLAKGTKIKDFNHFKQILNVKRDPDESNEDFSQHHIIVEFYMKGCHFCKVFVNDWN